jgi:hypothetical protein
MYDHADFVKQGNQLTEFVSPSLPPYSGDAGGRENDPHRRALGAATLAEHHKCKKKSLFYVDKVWFRILFFVAIYVQSSHDTWYL